MEFIRRYVPLNGSILDVGCGNGIFSVRFAEDGASVIGLDFSHHLLQENPHRRLICGDAGKLPFDDETFDAVFEANVLHHVADRELVVREMHRVSRRYLVFLEPNRYNPIMAAFSILVAAERGGLKSCVSRLVREARTSGSKIVATLTTGMISQNNTPRSMVSWPRRFDRPIWWGEYIIVIAEKIPLSSQVPTGASTAIGAARQINGGQGRN
jgi:SAM-dependent methyltransferase